MFTPLDVLNVAPLPISVDLTICPCCGNHEPDIGVRYRNTAYVDEDRNLLTSCGDCWLQDYLYYQDLWDDYNRGRL